MAPLRSSITRSVGKLFGVQKTDQVGGLILPDLKSASGGNHVVTPGNGYKYHTFTSPGTFTVFNKNEVGSVEILVVGGGGGRGSYQAGGGGAGGLAYNPSISVVNTSYPIVVGPAGGVGGNGGNSGALGITGLGGGTGGTRSPNEGAGQPGGSGGGHGSQTTDPVYSGTQPSQPQPTGTSNYGNPGGGADFNSPPIYGGGGGGGAGGSGGYGTGSANGAGGNGVQYTQFEGTLIGLPSLAPLNGYFAGGGGATGNGGTAGTSGLGSGISGSGGGGDSVRTGGNPGVVIIRYAVSL